MEPSKEPISVRIHRLSQQISGKTTLKEQVNLLSRDGLLDALLVLYDECNSECLKKYDKNVAEFVDKYKKLIREIRQLRVNISDFEVKNVIGRGHFGEVHIVRERQTGDVYAMKTVRKTESLDPSINAFEEERDIMALSHSPWLTSLQYAFQDNTNLYFIMEYHPGGDLLGLLFRQGGTLPESAACFYIAELVLALNDLHNMGYIHRDVKPDNILLDRCGHLKLADFGSAAKLNSNIVTANCQLPVGTPEYIAPEVLQSYDDKKNQRGKYGTACDYWSVGILAYEITVGNTPFNAQNTSATYSKIMNFSSSLKFPADIVLTQGYISLIKGLLRDQNSRLDYNKIVKLPLFKNIDFDGLRDQVPPFVPKITSVDDISNFSDIQPKKNAPNIENFKTKTKFSGKNLPFIGFTFTHDLASGNHESYVANTSSNDTVVQSLKAEVDTLQRKLMKCDDVTKEHESLERKLEEKTRKLESAEAIRDKLERDIVTNLSEVAALRRKLENEKKERCELETKALDLIKSAKQKWESSEKTKVDALNREILELKQTISKLGTENAILNDQVNHHVQTDGHSRISLEHVERINRKSIIGLELKMQKMAKENMVDRSNLQLSVTKEKLQNSALQRKLEEMQKEHNDLQEELEKLSLKNEKDVQQLTQEKADLEKKLREANTEIENNRKDMKGLKNSLNNAINQKGDNEKLEEQLDRKEKQVLSMDIQMKSLRNEIEDLREKHKGDIKKLEEDCENKLKEVGEKVEKTSREKYELENRLKEAELQNKNHLVKVKSLEELLKRLESGVSRLEHSSERETVLQEQIQRLEHQLADLHETSALERQELTTVKSKLWRVEKDLSNAVLDKKIVERDYKDAKEHSNKLLKDIESLNMKMKESKQVHEAALMELSDLNENLASEIMKLKEVIKSLEDKMSHENEKNDMEKKNVVTLQNTIVARDNKIKSLEKTIQNLEMDKFNLNGKLVEAKDEKSKWSGEVEALKQNVCTLNGELQVTKKDLENTQVNLTALREVCTLLENQLFEYEKVHSQCAAKEEEYKKKAEELLNQIGETKRQLQQARSQTNEEKSFRLMAETKCKKLSEEVQAYQNDMDVFKSQCSEFKSYSNSLSEELTILDQKVIDYEANMKTYEHQIQNYVSENAMLKEEVSRHITHLNNLKETNYKLNRHLLETKHNSMELSEQIQALETALDEKTTLFNDRELKLSSTIQQQTKLIDYLQSKMEDSSKKKKTLSDKLFGGSKKENVPPLPVVFNYRDLESELAKQKDIAKNLRQEIVKLKSETIDCVRSAKKVDLKEEKVVLDQLVLSPTSQKSDLYRQNSTQRMRHNIPHKFESKLCTNPSKCPQCGDQLSLGRYLSVCKECNVSVHQSCVPTVPRSCGIPEAFVNIYKDSIQKLKTDSMEGLLNIDSINVESWIKTPIRGNTGWEKRYACLSAEAVKIYQDKPSNPAMVPLEIFELFSEGCTSKVVFEPTPSDILVPVANNDLPFVIKLEARPTEAGHASKSVIIMTLSVEEKEKWTQALRQIYDHSNKYTGEIILKLDDEDFEVNTVVDFSSNCILLGADQGLFSHSEGRLLYIGGLSRVYEIKLLPKVRTALMLANEVRYLVSCDLDHLSSLTQCAEVTQPTLKFKIVNVNGLNGFHIIQVSEYCGEQIVCVATSKQLVLLRFDSLKYELVPLRILDTAEPTSCILFTERSLIIGANKFYEIDLNNYDSDEFLDISDKKLSHISKCYKMGSFPLGIFQVNKDPIEYLVCFYEFATFVDEYGCCSRNQDVKWSAVPLGFHFSSPYLYVIHYSSVKIVRIDNSSFNSEDNEPNSFIVDLGRVKYLGPTKKGMYLQHFNAIKFMSASKIDGELSMDSESLTTDDNDERFSLTSSMLLDLDENQSDSELEAKTEKRRVKFATTTEL